MIFSNRFERFIQKMDRISPRKTKVYIVPTALGFKFIGCNFLIFLMALSYSNNMGLLIAFIMVAYLVITMLETHKYIQDTKVDSINIGNFFLSHPINLNIKLKQTPEIRCAEVLQIELISEELKLRSEIGLKGADQNRQVALQIFQRGYYRFNNLKLFTYGHNKLFYVWRYFPLQTSFYVYPAKRFISQKRMVESNITKDQKVESEFQFHIPYQTGMTSKRIDWKVFARTDSLYWKKHTDDQSESVEINYQAFEGEHETRLEYMCFLVDKNFKVLNNWKLVLPQKILNFNKGHYHYQKSLEQLSVI